MSSMLQSIRARMLRRYGYDRNEVLAGSMMRMSGSHAPTHFSTLWTDAIFGWGNERFAAEERYLSEVVHAAERTSGSILECGSGLTTLLMGTVATRRGIQLHALEHNADWHARVSRAIRDFGLTNVTVHLAPLREFGAYDWYDAPLRSLPSEFSLVICDGPPGFTRGGRSGMLPRMREKLAPTFSILLDDTNRPAERQLVQDWSRELGASPNVHTGGRGFARVDVHGG
jgi:hypothetical protein